MKSRQQGFTVLEIILVIAVLGLLGFISWQAYAAYNKPALQEENSSKNTPNVSNNTEYESLKWERIESGQKRYSVRIPDGWEIIRPLDGDWLIIPGMEQPVYAEGSVVTVKDTESYGTDEPSIFSILIYDNISEPRGTASDFSIGSLKGKKYTYVAPEDNGQELGHEDKGDKTYDYRFDLSDGNELAIWYRVFVNTDARDQVETVDKIVQSIELQ